MIQLDQRFVGFALYQTANKKYNSESERRKAQSQRKKERIDNDYSSIGDWSPEDELPDPDEVGETL